MQVGNRGVLLIQGWEGVEDGDPRTVNLDPYMDVGERWTIGYGHLIHDERGGGVLKGPECEELAKELYPDGITLDEATELMRQDFDSRVLQLNILLGDAPTTQNQFDALFSLLYNVGSGRLSKSPVLAHHRAREYTQAADSFRLHNTVDGKVVRGLVNRREDERRIYLTPDEENG